MFRDSKVGASGTVSMKVFPGLPARPLHLSEMLRLALPWFDTARDVAWWRIRNLPNVSHGFWRICIARITGLPHAYGQLRLTVRRENGETVDLGLASLRVITNVGTEFLVDAWLATPDKVLSEMKYHGFGHGTPLEAVTDTALIGEFTTEYENPDTRPPGTNSKQGAVGNILRSVAMFVPQAPAAVTEHGLFSAQGGFSAGVLWDRSKFAVINLSGTGDSLQATYECTFAPGG